MANAIKITTLTQISCPFLRYDYNAIPNTNHTPFFLYLGDFSNFVKIPIHLTYSICSCML